MQSVYEDSASQTNQIKKFNNPMADLKQGDHMQTSMNATTAHANMLTSFAASQLSGEGVIPGDKSMSHRALMLGSLAIGTTKVTGLLRGADVLSTLSAMQALGVEILDGDDGDITITGVGTFGLRAPSEPLDLGNAGTGVRLLMGLVAGQPITATFTGDDSLSKRPMRRITDPLELMGPEISVSEGGLLPVTITGTDTPLAVDYTPKVASAQIKSAILLAAINARGTTIIREPHISRDHTESMLRHFGVEISQEIADDGQHIVSMAGEQSLKAADILVPRDPSSAAFAMVAALITEGSDITLPAIGMNPQRTGLITTLIEMGGDITISNERVEGGEPIADLRIRSSTLKGITVPAERAASMIDEYPILSVAAAIAEGSTYMPGIAELRVKETDRISVTADGLRANGVDVSETEDSMTVIGNRDAITGGAIIDSCHDHRIAMSFLTLGMVSKVPITVSNIETIATSFPGFADLMNGLGADIRAGNYEAAS